MRLAAFGSRDESDSMSGGGATRRLVRQAASFRSARAWRATLFRVREFAGLSRRRSINRRCGAGEAVFPCVRPYLSVRSLAPQPLGYVNGRNAAETVSSKLEAD